jgi:hypothetical protein
MKNNKNNISTLKPYAVLFMTLTSAIVSSIFWVQNYGEDHYYPLSSGEHIEEEHREIKADIEKIRDQNIEMILMLGRIEGALSND